MIADRTYIAKLILSKLLEKFFIGFWIVWRGRVLVELKNSVTSLELDKFALFFREKQSCESVESAPLLDNWHQVELLLKFTEAFIQYAPLVSSRQTATG